jgi:branched-chain amino acid transport system substrate-binding protein
MRPTAALGQRLAVDYLKLINARWRRQWRQDAWEECETGYATDRGVECYERLKGKGGA